MAETIWGFFTSFFLHPSAWGIGIALAFGAAWLLAYWPPLLSRPWLWAVLLVSAFLTLASVAFLQIPLQTWSGQALAHFWSTQTLLDWILLAGIPAMLLSGLVQEGAKLVPCLIYLRLRRPAAKAAIAIGAVAGAGFGIFEAQWVLNTVFAAGWTWGTVELQGWQALLPFWERFFAVAFHTAATAIAVYGFVRGWGWQFYLLASFLHAFINYSVLFLQAGLLTTLQVEIYVALWALAVAGAALWLRWRPEPLPIAAQTQEQEPG